MCVFCAAIPAAASVGVAVSSRQRIAADEAEKRGDAKPPARLPAGRISAGIVVLLVAGSIVYHTRFSA